MLINSATGILRERSIFPRVFAHALRELAISFLRVAATPRRNRSLSRRPRAYGIRLIVADVIDTRRYDESSGRRD